MQPSECPCFGDTLDRFLRPSVMAVLARAPGGLHGYLVAQHLLELPIFRGCPPDPTGLYRVLRTMENEGYLRSVWDREGSAPAKRVYRLTGDGLDCLQRWGETLETYAALLQHTVAFVQESARQSSEGELP
jgi:PadR family transcriptional regulator PadR